MNEYEIDFEIHYIDGEYKIIETSTGKMLAVAEDEREANELCRIFEQRYMKGGD